MPLDSVGRYVANHKVWDHVGNMIPVVEHSEGVRPHGEFKPATWLPVQFFDKYYENWFVMMPGKILAFDNQGRVVPAQYNDVNVNIVYTANDVDAGTIDARTGTPVTAPATFTVDSVTDFLGTGVKLAVSKPVGVAPYAILQWAGDGSDLDDGFTPAAYKQHNYNMQHQIAILCDYVLELPLVPAEESAEDMTQDSFADSKAVFTALGNLPVAKNTMRTQITFGNGTLTDAATRFVVEKDSADDVLAAGDWHIDLATGVVTVWASATLGGGNLYTCTYSHYAAAPTGSNVSRFASALGDLKPGDFVKCNADSNFVVADPSTENFSDIIGQVLEVEDLFAKDALDKVRTAYDSIGTNAAGSLPGYAGQMDQMPGSATGGVSDKVHYAGAANLVVRINLISR